MELLLYFFISLIAILISCIVFSNSVEWLGAKLNLSHGITGSLLAAVGTALPETIVPLVAIFWGINKETLIKVLKGEFDTTNPFSQYMNQISIGAIIGAPFMLSTIAFFLIGFASWIYFKTGRRKSKEIKMDETVLERDLTFFIISFSLAFLAVFLNHTMHILFGIVMILIYVIYLYLTIKEEARTEFKGEELEENLDPFLLTKLLSKLKPNLLLIWLQLIVSLLFLIFSAHHFVEVIKEVSHKLNFPAFIISLLLTPLATELPEKFNSWMWIRQKKDTLAVGNISGALVFQSTFPVTIGLLFTSWKISSLISSLTFIFCLINTSIVLISLKKKRLTYRTFLFCGILYLAYLFGVFIC
ncbi:MAG: sodium:calcium antiporter [Candidatus Melainabacteria bacterium]|nr:sodium:calcium antiporter [Candidatus Melainabacteria bacterium]